MIIYRGESLVDDSRINASRQSRVQIIKAAITFNDQLPSKMIGDGCPYRIFKYGFEKNVIEHISQIQQLPGNPNGSHFISFSEKEPIARSFATHKNTISIDAVNSKFNNYKSTNEKIEPYIEYIMITLNIEKRVRIEKIKGLYSLAYNNSRNLLLLNSFEYLSGIENQYSQSKDFQEAKVYSLNEAEWLVLPIDELKDNLKLKTFTAMLDIHSNETKYELYLKPSYIHAL